MGVSQRVPERRVVGRLLDRGAELGDRGPAFVLLQIDEREVAPHFGCGSSERNGALENARRVGELAGAAVNGSEKSERARVVGLLLDDFLEQRPRFGVATRREVGLGKNDPSLRRVTISHETRGFPAAAGLNEKSREVVIKRSLSPGFAGIPNPLFAMDNTLMFFNDGKKAFTELISAVKEM